MLLGKVVPEMLGVLAIRELLVILGLLAIREIPVILEVPVVAAIREMDQGEELGVLKVDGMAIV
jgi:hypothetical protein